MRHHARNIITRAYAAAIVGTLALRIGAGSKNNIV
jgi:hypothetical protein